MRITRSSTKPRTRIKEIVTGDVSSMGYQFLSGLIDFSTHIYDEHGDMITHRVSIKPVELDRINDYMAQIKAEYDLNTGERKRNNG